jgi:hypothetical protein
MEYELFKIRFTYIINIMSKQILSEDFRRMQKLAGILTESVDTIQDLDIESLKKELSKTGLKTGKFMLVDKDGKEHEMEVNTDGSITDADVNEGFKDKLLTGVVCTMLATGMVSCTKEDTAGFGYNVSSRSTEYTLDKGTPNKKVTISTPTGDEEHEVDSTLGDTKFYAGSQPLKFGRPMTPTEALIIKIGHAYQTEKGMNNKKGTPANKRWDYDPENSEITGKGTYYQKNETPFDDARQHPLWKLGIEAAEKAGKDIQALMQKADKEVQAQDWINEMDVNDPVMMKLRAKKDTKPNPTKPTTKAPNPNQSKIDQLKKHRADIIRDMEQEAELEGGPIADEYADKLRMIDIALRKLKA